MVSDPTQNTDSTKNVSKPKTAQAHARQLRETAKRHRRNRAIGWAVGGAVVLVAAAVVVTLALAQPSSKPGAATTPDAATTPTASSDANAITEVPSTPAIIAIGARTKAPWAAPADASGRTALAGLPMLSTEGTALHIHAHLSVQIDGTMVPVPPDLGIDLTQQRISPLHTHDAAGIIHVESPVASTFTLGQLFTEWDVALDSRRIGAYQAGDGQAMTVFVDGKPVSGNPAAIEFANHQDIAIVLTKPGQSAVAPDSFVWPKGY